jgi:hypothetical protein
MRARACLLIAATTVAACGGSALSEAIMDAFARRR